MNLQRKDGINDNDSDEFAKNNFEITANTIDDSNEMTKLTGGCLSGSLNPNNLVQNNTYNSLESN